MTEALDFALSQPLGIAILIILVWALITERIVSGQAHQRALTIIEAQRETLARLTDAVEADIANSEMTLAIVKALDHNATRRGEQP